MSADLLSERLERAVSLAFAWHGRDARKRSPVPVVAHLTAVCALVQHDGGDEDEAVAALLHDALEDKPELDPASVIEAEFGPRVLHLVQVATDTPMGYKGGPKPPWDERKKDYLARILTEDPADLRVTVADKVDNVRAILADATRLGPPFWTRFNAGPADQSWYYRSAYQNYRKAGFSGPLLEELGRLVSQLKLLVEALPTAT